MLPRLTYFDARGRAEPIRLLLAELDIAHDDVRLAPRDSQDARRRSPFGQLPTWEEGDLLIAQTRVILHHVADPRLAPPADTATRLLHAEAEAAIEELFEGVVTLCWSRTFEADRERFVAHRLARFLPALNAHLARSGGVYWGGDDPVVADFMAWNLIDDLRPLAPGVVQRSAPRLHALWEAFGARPRIAAYVADRRPSTIALPQATFGGTAEES